MVGGHIFDLLLRLQINRIFLIVLEGEIEVMDKEKDEELEWIEAQKIEISVDLFGAAKQQLQFLKTVDRNRWLYDGPALERAIYRSNLMSESFLFQIW